MARWVQRTPNTSRGNPGDGCHPLEPRPSLGSWCARSYDSRVSDRTDSTVRPGQERNEEVFGVLAERLRAELLVHCYRMLGSLHEAEDVVQETLMRAWRAFRRFEPRASFRAWLYKIATNACLDVIRNRPRRTFPVSASPAANPLEPTGKPADEFRWLEPFPDLVLPHTPDNPEARVARREGMSLAFIVALQWLRVVNGRS